MLSRLELFGEMFWMKASEKILRAILLVTWKMPRISFKRELYVLFYMINAFIVYHDKPLNFKPQVIGQWESEVPPSVCRDCAPSLILFNQISGIVYEIWLIHGPNIQNGLFLCRLYVVAPKYFLNFQINFHINPYFKVLYSGTFSRYIAFPLCI